MPDRLEVEHVFPESWYEAARLPSEMLTVPACGPCNRFFGKHDHDGRLLAMACHENNGSAARATERFFDAMDPSRAADQKDRRARQVHKAWVLSLFTPAFESEASSRLWSIGGTRTPIKVTTESGLEVDAFAAFTLPDRLQAVVVHKWIRGCFYHACKRPLPLFVPWNWRAPTADDDPMDTIRFFASGIPEVFAVRDFRVWGAVLADGVSSIWQFAIWNELIYWGGTGAICADWDVGGVS